MLKFHKETIERLEAYIQRLSDGDVTDMRSSIDKDGGWINTQVNLIGCRVLE